MPTYEYKCDACGHAFEKFQSITATPIKKCPQCGKSRVRRLIGTGAGMIFKGSGFYITDYRSEGYKSAAKADGGGTSSPNSSSGSNSNGSDSKGGQTKASETKPAAAPPAKTEPKPAATSKPANK